MKINATLACDCSTTEFAIIGLNSHGSPQGKFEELSNKIILPEDEQEDTSHGCYITNRKDLSAYGDNESIYYIGININDNDNLSLLKDEFISICKELGIGIDRKDVGFYFGTVGSD